MWILRFPYIGTNGSTRFVKLKIHNIPLFFFQDMAKFNYP